LSSRTAFFLALFGNLVIAAITLGALGWNSSGSHAAARNTARFSGLCCAAALASPAVFRIFRRDVESQLILTFVAAHVVHFLTVAALLFSFERSHIAARPGQSAAVIAVGSSLIVVLGVTAAAARPWAMTIRSLTLYAASLIFFLAFFHHSVWLLRAIAALLVFALLLRLASNLSLRTAGAKPT
jgi:hypothetical protein